MDKVKEPLIHCDYIVSIERLRDEVSETLNFLLIDMSTNGFSLLNRNEVGDVRGDEIPLPVLQLMQAQNLLFMAAHEVEEMHRNYDTRLRAVSDS